MNHMIHNKNDCNTPLHLYLQSDRIFPSQGLDIDLIQLVHLLQTHLFLHYFHPVQIPYLLLKWSVYIHIQYDPVPLQ